MASLSLTTLRSIDCLFSFPSFFNRCFLDAEPLVQEGVSVSQISIQIIDIIVVFVEAGIFRNSLSLSRDGIDIHKVTLPVFPELYSDFLSYKDVSWSSYYLDGQSCMSTVDLDIAENKWQHLQKGIR